jgi:hypothetical protein
VVGEVGGRAAELFAGGEEVPEDFAEGENERRVVQRRDEGRTSNVQLSTFNFQRKCRPPSLEVESWTLRVGSSVF